MRKILPSLLATLAATSSFAAINWQTTTGGVTIKNIDGVTPLVAGRDDAVGYFVQLIFAGANGIIDPVNTTVGSNGVSGDDVVIDVSWIGNGLSSTPPAGVLGQQTEGGTVPVTLAPNNRLFVRAWNAPWSGAVVGTTAALQLQTSDGTESAAIVTASPTLAYGNSALQALSPTYSAIDTVVFNIESFSTDTLVNVPEPTTAALLSMGFAGVTMALKRRRQRS